MDKGPLRLLGYPQARGHQRKRPPPVDLPVPSFSRQELLVALGIVLILLAILVPVVMKVRAMAVKDAEEYQRRNAPMTLDD
jgi:hypothetical protein